MHLAHSTLFVRQADCICIVPRSDMAALNTIKYDKKTTMCMCIGASNVLNNTTNKTLKNAFTDLIELVPAEEAVLVRVELSERQLHLVHLCLRLKKGRK